MDALTRTRQQGSGGQPLDVTQQFLTTSMLPKLATLHDDTDNIFFMATNHRRDFDDAIVRPGRFDLLIFMPPPKWKQKLERIGDFWEGHDDANVQQVRTLLTGWVDSTVGAKLDFFTFGELKALLSDVKRKAQRAGFSPADNLHQVLSNHLGKDAFLALVEEWSTKYIALRETAPRPTGWRWRKGREENRLLQEFREDELMSRRQ
jgi:SpoVK/Ycf46/Vps4 family AAA+-type ATPase